MLQPMTCIAAGPELWFEKPGFPPVPPHRLKLPRPWQNAVLSGAAPNILPAVGGKRGLRGPCLGRFSRRGSAFDNAVAQAVGRIRRHLRDSLYRRRSLGRERSAGALATRP